MLRAIRRFVFGRARSAGQGSEGHVEIDGPGDEPTNSDDAVQSAGQDPEEPSEPPVRGTVKWFSSIKGYGFVVLSDGRGDAFLHASALAGISITNLQPGETLEFRMTLGQRGPQVTEVISVDRSTAAPLRPPRRGFGPTSDRQALEATVEEAGTVKWYNAIRGFGFIVLDGSGKEVFVHSSALKRAGISRLNERQRVFVGVAEGRKGPEVISIELAN